MVLVAYSLIAVQLAFRAWAIYGGWFYTDDMELLYTAPSGPITLGYLFEPHAAQLFPGVLILVWLTTQFGLTNWAVGASLVLLLQVAASLSCFHMLRVLFAARWAIIAPLSVFLFSVLGVPGFVWWASGLLTGALLIALFQAVSSSVTYLRNPSWKRAFGPALWVLFGLFFHEKSVTILPLLAYVTLAYFSSGSLMSRLRTALMRYYHGVILLVATGGIYLWIYLATVPPPLSNPDSGQSAELADNLIGKSFLTGAFGGPFRWLTDSPPTAQADPPDWVVRVSWTLAALVILVGLLSRTRTLRSWILLLGYLLATLGLLATGRANTLGPILGLEYRYLTDAAGILCLVLGLVFLELRGAPEGSQPRTPSLLVLPNQAGLAATMTCVVSVGGVISSVSYLQTWHTNPTPDYLATAVRDINRSGAVRDLVNQSVPSSVMNLINTPYHRSKRLIGPVAQNARFPEATDELFILNDEGHLYRAVINPAAASQTGEIANCGWLVDTSGISIPLAREVWTWDWWMRIGYLASQDTPVTVTAGNVRTQTSFKEGIHSLYVHAPGTFSSVEIDGLASTATLCVDRIDVGSVTPGAIP